MAKEAHVDSLKKRYFYKLSSSVVSIPISMVTLGFIPRMLGPENYGNFYFLIYVFTQIASFIGSGNNFLLTRLAENTDDHGLKRFYFNFIGTGFFLLVIFVLISSSFGIDNIIFPDQNLKYIWMALLLVLCLCFSQIVSGIIDVYALTVKGEIVVILSKISGMLFLLFIYWSNRHNLTAVFTYRYFMVLFLIIGFFIVLKKNRISIYPLKKNTALETKNYIRGFYDYSMPLYMFSVIAILCNYLNRWLLQIFGGSIQQGYFSISNQISSFVILFSAALTPLLLREFSVSMGRNDVKRIAALFQRFIPMFYSIAAYFCIFIMFQAQNVVLIIGGKNFDNAVISVAIMSLYPMHYTTNGIIYPVFYSTRNTKLLRTLGILFYLVPLPFFFFLLAPNKYFGLNLGANGYAIGMVFFTFIAYNIYLWFSTRILSISFMPLFLHQFYSALLFALTAIISIQLSNRLFDNFTVSFLVSGIIYTIGTVVLLISFPSLFHVTKEEILKFLKIRLAH
jgi:O-antigen/teichoic acid export membrane protein